MLFPHFSPKFQFSEISITVRMSRSPSPQPLNTFINEPEPVPRFQPLEHSNEDRYSIR